MKATKKDKLNALRDYYMMHKHVDDTRTIKETCPFQDLDKIHKTRCADLCGQFEQLDTRTRKDNPFDLFMVCPCHAYGPHDAITRLRITLEKEGVI